MQGQTFELFALDVIRLLQSRQLKSSPVLFPKDSRCGPSVPGQFIPENAKLLLLTGSEMSSSFECTIECFYSSLHVHKRV